jgi:Tol biopolymer transport system component
MRRVIRRVLGVGVLTLLLTASAAVAAAPSGPRLALVRLGVEPLRVDLLTVDQTGAQPLRLAGGGRRSRVLPHYLSPLSWAPDGSQVVFSAIVGRRDGDDTQLRLFMVGADGGGLRPVVKTEGAYAPVFSPDGRSIAFTRSVQRVSATKRGRKTIRRRFEAAAIWLFDLASGAQRRITPWRNGLEHFASSFSPDGTTLLATRQDDRRTDEAEPVALGLDNGTSARLLVDGGFPVYSPDGSAIAVVREGPDDATDLYVLDAGGLRRLTRSPGKLELFPSWDPSGQRLAYVRFSGGNSETASFGIGDALMQINADGSCQMKTLSEPGAGFYVPAWQSGLGREAGRIDC